MIEIDCREPENITLELVANIGHKISMMPCGDYGWSSPLGKVLVERKSVGDLLSSIKTGRAATQMRGLIQSCDVPILLIEGIMGEHKDGKLKKGGKRWGGKKWEAQWDYVAIDHILLTWQLSGRFLVNSPLPANTARRLLSLFRWTQKPDHAAISRRKMISMKEDSGQVTTLATFPGIGHVRARILLQKYTLKQLLNMDRKELEKLVGTVTAGKMRAHYETTG